MKITAVLGAWDDTETALTVTSHPNQNTAFTTTELVSLRIGNDSIIVKASELRRAIESCTEQRGITTGAPNTTGIALLNNEEENPE
jgi:hypothetical protein